MFRKSTFAMLMIVLIALLVFAVPVAAKGVTQDAPAPIVVSVEFIASVAGIALSFAFSYIPKFREWFAVQDGDRKRLIMLGALFLVSVGVFALSCASFITAVSCDMAGAQKLITIFVTAAIANQAAYMLSPLPKG